MKKAKAKTKRKTGTALAVHRPQAPARPPEGASPLEMIIWASRDRTIDAAKLRELVQLRNEEEARAAQRAFSAAFQAAKDEMPVVMKDATNDDNKAKYAKLETVSRAVDPIIRRHGLSLSYGMAESKLQNHYKITCRVRHGASGYYEDHSLDLPADSVGIKGNPNKTPIQGVSSSVTYARRILKIAIFDVNVANNALPDDDGRGSLSGCVTPEVAQQIINALDDAGLDKVRFCQAFEIDGVSMLPAKRAREALDRIEQYRKQHAPAAAS